MSTVQRRPGAPTIRISYEPTHRAIWHTDCTNHFGGVMTPERHETTRSLMRCGHCGKAGWYPVGAVGERVCEAQDEQQGERPCA